MALDSPFSTFRRRGSNPQLEIFINLDSDERSPELWSATACFCRRADCTGLWPVSSIDATNATRRPYACTGVEDHNEKDRVRFVTRTHFTMLEQEEPDP